MSPWPPTGRRTLAGRTTAPTEDPTMSETHIEGPPPGTNGAGGPGNIPPEYRDDTVDTDEHGDPPRQPDKAHRE